MSQELFAITKNGKSVWFDPHGSHAATHFTENTELPQHIKNILSGLDPTESSVYEEIKFDRPIGTTDLVVTDDTDDIIYAKRVGREVYTRFTTSRQPVSTNTITIWLVLLPNGDYNLASAWFGTKVPSWPGDKWEVPESKSFWKTHALVWGKQAIIEGTETTTCPW